MAQYNLKKIIKHVKFNDILNLAECIFVFPFAIIAKIFIRRFWLVCEDKNEARDNGYWFFKYVRENKPKQKIAYAINKKSPDYEKVKNLGKTISYGSITHWFWYIVADKNVSSQKGGKPNAAVCYFFEVTLKLRKNNRVFLQHGVTVNNGAWLYYKNCYFDKFLCATKEEYEYIKKHFGYPENRLVLTGFSRFDNLNDDIKEDDLILVMPSWREWLSGAFADGSTFTDSEYFKRWNEFLTDEEFIALLKKYGKRVIFYPHRNMQAFIDEFNVSNELITVAKSKDYDVQDLLKRAALLITDYSSVFFDFAYMRKPTLFYQFDETEFRARQYAKGYLDYRNTPLGKFADTKENLLALLNSEFETGITTIDETVVKNIFLYRDNSNNERIYNAVTNK